MQTPIAVVGVSALFPGSSDARGFWSDILAGRDLVTEVPPSHWLIEDYYDPDPAALDKTYCKRGAFLSPVDFNPMEFGVPPSIVPATDTAQILALIVAQKVLEDASQGQFAAMNRERISVLLGVTSAQELLGSMVSRLQRPVWIKALRESGIPETEAQAICDRMARSYVPWQEASFPGLLGNVVAGRIANRFDLRGTNAVVDAACASSLAAMSMGINELELGQSDLVIAGGVDTMNDIFMYLCFSKTPALSPTGDCRPFSDAADGTLLGEGMAMFALKRLADAERDGDRVYAVIRGLGSASDGRSKSVYAPLPDGQARALRRAYQAAGFGPETIELVEAHGTGTKAGDAAEFEGLCVAFRESGRGDQQWCALGSIKSQIGHTKAAAGAAGLFKAIMALHHKVLPPTIKIERPNPKFDLERSPFYLNLHARPWIRDGAHPRRAAVSSFGFGGSNFHVALEEYAPAGAARPAFRLRVAPTELVLLGARDAPGLAEQCRRMAERPGEIAQTARASQLGFRAREAARLAVCAASAQELSEKLLHAAAAIEKSPATPLTAPTGIFYSAAPAEPGRIAFVFPGQGSQYVGMGADVAMSIEAARAAWDQAAAQTFDGRGVHQVVFPAPAFTDEERDAHTRVLTATEWAQPALGVQSAALLRVLSALGVRPDCVAGHSFGEVVALHAAGAIDEATLVRVSRRRGELMREAASTPGAMTAVARSIDDVRPVLAKVLAVAGAEVVIANHNAPEQVVLSGAQEAIARVEEALAATQIPAKRLTVATAFHSPLVAGSSAPFLDYLRSVDLAAPEIDVYGCADAMPYPREAEAVRRRLAAQLAQPVRFVEQIEAMYASGVRTFLEVGPGSVLSELIDRILGAREHRAIHLDRKGRHGLTSLQHALGRLAVAGVSMKFSVLWDDLAPPVETPATKPAMSIPVSGVNQGKPYPPVGGAKELPPPNAPRPVEPRPVEPPRAVMETPPAQPPLEAHGEWLRAYQAAQRQTAEAHAAYQRAMADSHMAFLRTAETSFAGLGALLGGQPIATAPATISQQLAEAVVVPAIVAPPVVAPPAFVGPVSTPIIAAEPPRAPVTLELPKAAPEPAAQAVDLEALMMSVVADKTGYPAEMLGAHMDLEADLGIDSIKRVEILAAFRESAPGLPEVKATELGQLRTLGQIVDHMRAVQGAPAPHPANGHATAAASAIGPAAAAPASAAPAIARRALREVPAPAVGLAPPGLHDASEVVVTEDGGGLAALVVEELGRRGVKARVAFEVPPSASAVIFLGGMREVGSIDDAIAVDREAFRAARAVAARFETGGGLFVTVQDTGGDFGLSGCAGLRAWSGGLSALARTSALEWPRASVRAIDCERGARSVAAIARALVDELCTGGVAIEVGLHADGRRTTLAMVEAGVTPEASPRIGASSVVVASGGGRGVTAAGLVALARACRPRIVLLGRTPLPTEPDDLPDADALALKRAMATKARVEGRDLDPAEISAHVARVLAQREIRATLDALAAAGSPARYIAVDVQDVDAISAALDDVRREWGPVTALVHGAGVIADKRIVDKSDEQFARVFDTKVTGLRALLSATAHDPLESICVYSSIAARTGNLGQCDYAMANEVLNLVAASERARRGDACVVRAIGWGPWAGGMVTPSLEKHFAQMGVPLIPLDAGARVFVDELRGGGGDVTIVVGGAAGGGPLGAEAGRAVSLELRVDAASHPPLADHRIAGTAVAPVAMALEWILRGALAVRPDLACAAVRDVKVLRPLKLERFDRDGDLIEVRCRQVAGDSDGAEISVELRGRDDALHYRAAVEMARLAPAAPPTPSTPPLEAFDAAGIYDGHVLFHGPLFRVIRDVEGISRAGIAGTLQGSAATGWPADGWRTDPALLDGGLQLAVVWARHVLGGASLPMAVRELRSYREGVAEGPVRCVVSARETSDLRAVSDVVFTDASGAVVAELLGVETVMRPDEAPALATALG